MQKDGTLSVAFFPHSLLREAGAEPFLLQSVKNRKLSYYGHVLRKEGNCTEKEIMQGTTSGQRRRGRPRTRWQDNITKWTGLNGDRLLKTMDEDYIHLYSLRKSSKEENKQ